MELLDQLKSLCVIDSRTTAGAAGTVQVSQMLGDWLKPLGFDLKWFDTLPEEGPRGKHLVAIRKPQGKPGPVFVAHSDTVLSPEEVPFRFEAETGRVIGSGTCDMKGGCVVMVEAIKLALREPAVQQRKLIVLVNCSEETAGPSFPKLAREIAGGASACLCFEPARPAGNGAQNIVIARKGGRRFVLEVRGRAAHAGNAHEQGVNAIRELARKIEAVELLTDPKRSVTVNVGAIQGGHVANQVADYAKAIFEARAFDRQILEETAAAIRAICATPTVRSAADGATTQLSLSEYATYPAWPRNAATDALAERFHRIAERYGLRSGSEASGGGSDAAQFAELMPTIDGLGILGYGLHTPHEWADMTTLPQRIRSAADLVLELCHE